ncbi:MAG: CPBP family intramembrane metalloprotease [Acidobacteria bacterium]|nr:CPBP family intramembrane metalloprotease [Acidobacteriota bacterium]
MNSIFIDQQSKHLRSGWRALIFLILSPFALILVAPFLSSSETSQAGIAVNLPTIISYVVQVGWLLLASWLCLKYLEQMRLGSLGFAFFRGWWREMWLGFSMAALMIIAVVVIQAIGGGTRLLLNPMFWKSADSVRRIDWIGFGLIFREIGLALVLFALAAAFEELLFRGYPFQTLLRGGISPAVPIILLSVFFGVMHLGNPSSTKFSTVNTILAGIWLSIAYLKTRSLWFPTALHLGWNWTMGAFFGIPVSGLKLVQYPVFLATSDAPLWLTGGSYGCEGGAVATFVLAAATLLIWKVKWLRIAPDMQAALDTRDTEKTETIKLGLVE